MAPYFFQEIQLITPPGDYVGRVQQQCTWMVPFFLIRDANDQVLFVVEGPAVMQRSALLLAEFKVAFCPFIVDGLEQVLRPQI